ncbi:MAG: ABC transporter permease [Terriglobia bacterium]
MISSLLFRVRAWFRRRSREEELEEEVQSHLRMAAKEHVEYGESAEQARTAALREFGNVGLVKDAARDMWGWRWLETLRQDVRFAARMLRRSPGFTAVAVLSLALGIGANTGVFSLINTLMLRLLPVRDPASLVELLHQYPGEPRMNGYSWQSYEHFRDHNHVFSGLIGFSPSRFDLRGEGLGGQTVDGEYVVGDFFPVLGVKPAIGRLIGPEDDRLGGAHSAVAVVSWSFWKSRFNLDPGILGKRIILQGAPVTVIGVTPREFFGLEIWSRPEVWVPTGLEPVIDHSNRPIFGAPLALIGRLKPGVSIEQARAEMNVLFQFTLDEMSKGSKNPLMRKITLDIVPAGAGLAFLRDQFEQPLLVLMALVGLLLLIACTSIATLLLARGAAREREMALRISLGAGKMRLLRQVMTESLLVSGAGSLLGILVAYFGARSLVRILLSGRPIVGLPPHFIFEIQPDAHVLLFSLGAALLTGVLFGLVPTLRAMASAPASMLQGAVRPTQARATRFFGKSLVAVQVALSVVVLSLAGVFTRHLSDLRNQLGFERDHLLLVSLDTAHSGYSAEQLAFLYQELLGRLDALPGVRSATIGSPTPISGAGAASFVDVEGHQQKPEDRRYVALSFIAPKYFQTLSTPLLAGRDFTFQDEGGPRVAIIDQAMARYYFADANPIGRHFTIEKDWKNIGGPDKPYEIVGVVGDAKYDDAHGAAPRTIYMPAFGDGRLFASDFILRTRIPPDAVTGDVRRSIAEILKGVEVLHITTMSEQVDAAIVPERLVAMLSGSFGTLGLILAAVGLYGLLAYTAARRTKEIGVRMALGASRKVVTWMVLRDALVMVLAGLGAGIPVALWSRKFAGSLIEGLPPSSVLPISVAALGVIAVALLASYIPARRATKVDPMEALRYE